MEPGPTDPRPTKVQVCSHCGREIEFCSFCDRTECGVASCYGCLVIALDEAKPALHVHGG